MRTFKQIRKDAGVTQQFLSDTSGISLRTIKYAEAGKSMSIDTIIALAPPLGVHIMDLVEVNKRCS